LSKERAMPAEITMSQDPILPIMSLAERDRRYANVRREMAARGLDCLVMFQNTGEWDACQPDARYLSCVGGGGTAVALVFPADTDPIVIVREPRRAEYWKSAQNWVDDVRGTQNGHWGGTLVQAVRDVGCENPPVPSPTASSPFSATSLPTQRSKTPPTSCTICGW
jgi:Xaa-Pro aminopeptidase